MSKQLGLYLVPADAAALVAELQQQVGLRLLHSESSQRFPIAASSPLVSPSPNLAGCYSSRISCYLAPPERAQIEMQYSTKLDIWRINPEPSEVVEFSGCDFDGKLLLRGRLFYMPDTLHRNKLISKGTAFIDWADSVVNACKKYLLLDRKSRAYMGVETRLWKTEGGRLASHLGVDRQPVFED